MRETAVVIRPGEITHIKVIRPELCESCEKICTTTCPGRVFVKEGNRIAVLWERCLECGACYMICPKGNVDWGPPEGGRGVAYKYG